MDKNGVKELLQKVAEGEVNVDEKNPLKILGLPNLIFTED